jgi:hypothetical protein
MNIRYQSDSCFGCHGQARKMGQYSIPLCWDCQVLEQEMPEQIMIYVLRPRPMFIPRPLRFVMTIPKSF